MLEHSDAHTNLRLLNFVKHAVSEHPSIARSKVHHTCLHCCEILCLCTCSHALCLFAHRIVLVLLNTNSTLVVRSKCYGVATATQPVRITTRSCQPHKSSSASLTVVLTCCSICSVLHAVFSNPQFLNFQYPAGEVHRKIGEHHVCRDAVQAPRVAQQPNLFVPGTNGVQKLIFFAIDRLQLSASRASI
jgi:hypothetical protein